MYINRKGLQFTKRDTFDFSTISEIIVKWLEGFKEHHKNHPFAGLPSYYMDDTVPSDDEFKEKVDQFYADIDFIIWAFNADDMPEDCWLVKPTKNMFDGELDMEAIEFHRNKKQEGLDLFAKLFQSFWV